MKKPLVMLLAGGGGTRLGALVQHRSKPAVPFAGRYRVIDFTLSNVMHAGFDWVGVLTQYQPLSLMSHIGTGEPWNFTGRRRGVRILPPRTGLSASDWYRGTADAVWQSMDFMVPMQPERVLILSGDHIYRMDYGEMLNSHLRNRADLTVAVMEIDPRDSFRFGMVRCDLESSITGFEEKPRQTDARLASMGIYLFEWPCLVQVLSDFVGRGQAVDFGQDILPALLGRSRMKAYKFNGYWRDVGTVSSYFQANMDAIVPGSALDLDRWEICTQDDSLQGDRSPARFGKDSRIIQSLISEGCQIDGLLNRAVISPDVHIASSAVVEDSVLMHDVHVEEEAIVRGAILDKGVNVGKGAVIQGGRTQVTNQEYAKCDLEGMVVVGKNVHIPKGVRIGSAVVIEPGVGIEAFPREIPDGTTISPLENKQQS